MLKIARKMIAGAGKLIMLLAGLMLTVFVYELMRPCGGMAAARTGRGACRSDRYQIRSEKTGVIAVAEVVAGHGAMSRCGA